MIAAALGEREIQQVLLKNGANPTAVVSIGLVILYLPSFIRRRCLPLSLRIIQYFACKFNFSFIEQETIKIYE